MQKEVHAFSSITDNEVIQSFLPPLIVNNVHMKVEAEPILTEDLSVHLQQKPIAKKTVPQSILRQKVERKPRYPIALIWTPEKLCIDLKDKVVIKKLWIWNCSYHLIYIHCCGLWDETIRYGAEWRCRPRTRFLLAPGIKAEILIKAMPHLDSLVPCASSWLQIAAQYMRDEAVGHFDVPIEVKFNNYISSVAEEV